MSSSLSSRDTLASHEDDAKRLSAKLEFSDLYPHNSTNQNILNNTATMLSSTYDKSLMKGIQRSDAAEYDSEDTPLSAKLREVQWIYWLLPSSSSRLWWQVRFGALWTFALLFVIFHVEDASPSMIAASLFPLYASNAFQIYISVRETRSQWREFHYRSAINDSLQDTSLNDEIPTSLGGQIASIATPLSNTLDAIASFYFKLIFSALLVANDFPWSVQDAPSNGINLTLALIPSWLLFLSATSLKCLSVDWTAAKTGYTSEADRQLCWFVVFNTVVYFFFRPIQFFALSVAVDSATSGEGWVAVFLPSMILAFVGLTVGLITMVFNATLRKYGVVSTASLKSVSGSLITVGGVLSFAVSMLAFLFILWCSEALDESTDADLSSYGKYDRTFLYPALVIVFGTPVVGLLYRSYFLLGSRFREAHFAWTSRQVYEKPRVNPNGTIIEATQDLVWLLKINDNKFRVTTRQQLSAGVPSALKSNATGDVEMMTFGSSSEVAEAATETGAIDEVIVLSGRVEAAVNPTAAADLLDAYSRPEVTPLNDIGLGFQRSGDIHYCGQCSAREVDAVLGACGCATVCLMCALSLAQKSASRNRCPSCEQSISHVYHLSEKPFPFAPEGTKLEDAPLVAVSSVGYRVTQVSGSLTSSNGGRSRSSSSSSADGTDLVNSDMPVALTQQPSLSDILF